MAKTTPHLERWSTVAVLGQGRKVVLGGRREQGGSTAYVVGLAKQAVEATRALPSAVRVAVGSTGEHVLVGGDDGVLRVLDAGGELRAEHALGSGAIVAAARHPLHDVFVVATAGGSLARITLGEKGGAVSLAVEARALGAPATALCFALAGDRVVAGREDGQVEVVPATLVGDSRLLVVAEAAVTGLCALPDGRVGATGADGSLVTFFLDGAPEPDVRSGDHGHTLAARGLLVGPELYAPSGAELPRRVLTFGDDGAVKAWPLDSRRRPKTLETGLGAITAALHIRGKERGKPEDRGGLLVLVSSSRAWAVVPLGPEGELPDQVERIGSELDRLEAALAHNDHATRRKAVESLGEIPEDEARLLLERALGNDKKHEHRALAASLIEKRGWKKSRAALEGALGDSQAVVAMAVFSALWTLEPEQRHNTVAAALARGSDDLRTEAVGRLVSLAGTSPLVLSMVGERLGDAAPQVRLAALEAAFVLERSPLEATRLVLRKGAPDVRGEALVRLALTRSSAPEVAATVEAALDDADMQVRSVAYLLGVMARPRLRKALAKQSEAFDRAIQALEARGSYVLVDAEGPVTEDDKAGLFAALSARAPDTALRGATTLAALGDRRAIGAILGLSREGEEAVRLAALGALATSMKVMPDDDRARARVEWLLDDPSANVRGGAFEVLQQLTPDDVLGVVARALRSAHADVRARALQKLVTMPREDARTEALVGDALDDEAAEVRAEAQKTLWAWHARSLRPALERAARCRHADVRKRVAGDLVREKGDWPRALLLELVADPVAAVGLEAYTKLTPSDADKKRPDVHLAAMRSPRPELRKKGAAGARLASGQADELKKRLRALVEDDDEGVAIAALESLDTLVGYDDVAFAFAFASPVYELRVRAAELGGQRRDKRVIEPMRALLSIKSGYLTRPTEELRARAARAVADVGDPGSARFLASLLDDANGVVREMGARGLATAVRLGEESALVAALAHPDLPVRSWAAEGLARLGDARAVPVLAGTQRHEHTPIRRGALVGFVALGADGLQGILQGLSDPERDIQDLVFAVIVARDVAQARAGLAPDLLVSALSAAHPEIRFAAARALEARLAREPLEAFALELVGPRKPDDAEAEKAWPKPDARGAILQVLVDVLASDDPEQRYAAVQVLALRAQPEAFWREAQRLGGPRKGGAVVPHTNFSTETRQTRRKDWIRRLFTGGPVVAEAPSSATARVLTLIKTVGSHRPTPAPPKDGSGGRLVELVFGTYASLVRQAPPRGDSDETHRVRRDALARLATLAPDPRIGADVVRTIAERALSDPSALVRKQALTVVEALYPAGSLVPLERALAAGAADLGRQAIDTLVAAHARGVEGARERVIGALAARTSEVRMHALLRLPRVFAAGSLEPWVVALASPYSDVREAVVDRVGDARDPRVFEALVQALQSDDASLRNKAAALLARRGDLRALDVLAGLLGGGDDDAEDEALEALVALALAESVQSGKAFVPGVASARVAAMLATRLVRIEGDRDKYLTAYQEVGDPAGDVQLLEALAKSGAPGQSTDGTELFDALWSSAKAHGQPPRKLALGATATVMDTARVLALAEVASKNASAEVRARLGKWLGDVGAVEVEPVLGFLARDREAAVRTAAVEALAKRVERFPEATLAPLDVVLRTGRRELVLGAAQGLALRGRPEAFQPLMLVLEAGEPTERGAAALALGTLGDPRAIDALLTRLEPDAEEATPEDLALVPEAAEALARMYARSFPKAEDTARVRERVKLLLAEATDAVRTRVLEGLRVAGGVEARSLIEARARDTMEVSVVRRVSARELGRLGDVEAEATLAELLVEPTDATLALAAQSALLELFPRERTRVMLHALKSPFPNVSEPAASELSRTGEGATLSARLGEIDSAPVRERLVRGLVRRRAADVATTVRLLDSERPSLRGSAAALAVSLGGAGATTDATVMSAVGRALDTSAAQFAAALAAARKAGRRDSKAEARLTEEGEAWAQAWWAARVLGAPAAAAATSAALGETAPARVREATLHFLGARGTKTALDVVRTAMGDREPTVRRAAGQAAARLGESSWKPGEGGLVDVGSAVPVIGALGRAQTPLAQAGVPELVALSALGRADISVLVAIAEDATLGERPERLVAIAALARFVGRPEARACLEALTRRTSEAASVRKAAFRALRRLERAEALLAKAGDQDRGKGLYASAGGGSDEDESYSDDDGDSDDDDDDDDGDSDDDDGDSDDDDDGDSDDDDDGDSDDDDDSDDDEEDEDD